MEEQKVIILTEECLTAIVGMQESPPYPPTRHLIMTLIFFRPIFYFALILSLYGCAATPFKKSIRQVSPDRASKITITSENKNWSGGFLNMTVQGKVTINGEYLGDFSSSEPIFSMEVNPGVNIIEICHGSKCVKLSPDIQANSHYFYGYIYDSNFGSVTWTLRELRKEPYSSKLSGESAPIAPPIPTTKPQGKPASGQPSNVAVMEEARKKCIELGFKIGTESFGNCVLKVAN